MAVKTVAGKKSKVKKVGGSTAKKREKTGEIEKLKKKYKIVGTKEAVRFLKKTLRLKFKEKSIENQIIRKKVGKVVSVGKRKIRVFDSRDVEKLKKLYESYRAGAELKKKYQALGIKDLIKTLKSRYKIDTNVKRMEALISRLSKRNKIKRKYENYMGKKVLAFTKETVEKIVNHIKGKREKKPARTGKTTKKANTGKTTKKVKRKR